MSRTYRKRMESFESFYGFSFGGHYQSSLESWDEKEKQIMKARYQTKTDKWLTGNLPKSHRNLYNRKRRAKDSQALHKYIRNGDEDVLFDPWNCKTSHSWDYW